MSPRRLARITRWIDTIVADGAAILVGLVIARLLLVLIDAAVRSVTP